MLLLSICIAAAYLAGCTTSASQRRLCLDRLTPLAQLSDGAAGPRSSVFTGRLAELRRIPSPYLTYSELAWLLVPALDLEYRLRRGDDPEQCHALLAGMGLMPPDSAREPLSPADCQRLVNRAALPETELLLPRFRPLPDWLWAD